MALFERKYVVFAFIAAALALILWVMARVATTPTEVVYSPPPERTETQPASDEAWRVRRKVRWAPSVQ